LDVAQDAAALTIDGMRGVSGKWGDLKDQAERAAVSAALNLAESIGYSNGNKGRHRSIAYGSAKEARVAVALALKLGLGDRAKLQAAHDALDRVGAMTWRLMKRS
jgi:four helix bundle protein